ncbi:hypothetical protein ACTXT7_015767 [Hymenolepis weldensis]
MKGIFFPESFVSCLQFRAQYMALISHYCLDIHYGPSLKYTLRHSAFGSLEEFLSWNLWVKPPKGRNQILDLVVIGECFPTDSLGNSNRVQRLHTLDGYQIRLPRLDLDSKKRHFI